LTIRLVAGLAITALVVVPAFAATLRAPAENVSIVVGKWLPASSYQEEIGSVAILSENNIMRVADVYACDPLSNFGLLMNTTGKVAELHFVHSEYEQAEEYVWKVNVGSELSGAPTIEFVTESFTSHTQQELFQFAGDGYIYFCGQKSTIKYPDLLKEANKCPMTASALEIKVRMYPKNQLVTFQVINRGITSGFNKLLGPYPLIKEIGDEGVNRCIVKARPNSGTAYIDGVICQGQSLALPPPVAGGQVIERP
jgi:hypothetical protein